MGQNGELQFRLLWVSNELKETEESFATLRGTEARLSVLATADVMRAFLENGEIGTPLKLWAGWSENILVLTAKEIPGLKAYKTRWRSGGSPRLEIGLGRVLKKRGATVPDGLVFRVPVHTYKHPEHGVLILLRMDLLKAMNVNETGPRETSKTK